MTHPPNSLLLSLARGVTEPQGEASARAHIETCPTCRRRVEEYREVEAWLGEWTQTAGEHDVTDAVLARLHAAPAPPRALLVGWYRAARVAAAVVIGVGVGYAGSAALHRRPAPVPPADSPAFGADAGLPGDGLLAAPSASGLWLTLSGMEADGAAEDGT